MLLTVEVVPHKEQRYETAGDWQILPGGDIKVTVSNTGWWSMNFLVAFHEAIEAYLCKLRGIAETDVTLFDVSYEENREPWDATEPGDDTSAPYHREHVFASNVERLLAQEAGVDWLDYEKAIENL